MAVCCRGWGTWGEAPRSRRYRRRGGWGEWGGGNPLAIRLRGLSVVSSPPPPSKKKILIGILRFAWTPLGSSGGRGSGPLDPPASYAAASGVRGGAEPRPKMNLVHFIRHRTLLVEGKSNLFIHNCSGTNKQIIKIFFEIHTSGIINFIIWNFNSKTNWINYIILTTQ